MAHNDWAANQPMTAGATRHYAGGDIIARGGRRAMLLGGDVRDASPMSFRLESNEIASDLGHMPRG
jgi:hypothetical protein